MRLLGCLLLFGGILGSYSGTLRNPLTNECAEGLENHEYGMSKCDAGAPSQDWVLEGKFIKNQKSGTCLKSVVGTGQVIPFACSKTLHRFEKQEMIQIIIEGTEVKTANNWCMINGAGSQRDILTFASCGIHSKRVPRIVFE
jgi:hypothetical protein